MVEWRGLEGHGRCWAIRNTTVTYLFRRSDGRGPGFCGAPIEGPTHFSQFVPLLHQVFGDDWFVRGCIGFPPIRIWWSRGEEVQAMVEKTPTEGLSANRGPKTRWHTGINGTAGLGPDYGETELEQRMARLRPAGQL
ncbi:MAG: hypothetical protein CM15mP120_00690 [Pseudomonadota bacterium]|nr:MAG: hypothetical protein CM15mP120_00690 [Pseudomonadota bacterium]